jgi:hypothetical protein
MFVIKRSPFEGRTLMSAAKIQVPADHVGAIRECLIDRRQSLEEGDRTEGAVELAAIEDLLGQIAPGAGEAERSRELTGPRHILWSAAYDALCRAAEGLVDDCEALWESAGEMAAARARLLAIGARLELLDGLERPSGS